MCAKPTLVTIDSNVLSAYMSAPNQPITIGTKHAYAYMPTRIEAYE